MNLKARIAEDMKTAMKAGEKLKVSTLRLTSSAMTYAEKDKKRELNEDEAMEVVVREVKKRREAATEYAKAEREDLAGKERDEAAILTAYLPEQMSEAEINEIVKQAIEDAGAMGPGDLGKVMSVVIPKTKGRADGKLVNEIVRRLLEQGA
ncbi:MAG: GatB/YqeY domain-containing protein [Actinomycetota bacterium]